MTSILDQHANDRHAYHTCGGTILSGPECAGVRLPADRRGTGCASPDRHADEPWVERGYVEVYYDAMGEDADLVDVLRRADVVIGGEAGE